jgi:hypothetical protein
MYERALMCTRGSAVPFADIDDLSWEADDEASCVGAPWCHRLGWIWLSYILFGIAFCSGAGFAICALIAMR